MIGKIVKEVFKKAERECVSNAKNALAKHISDELENKSNLIINHKTLVRAYDKYVMPNGKNDSPPNPESVNLFCKYLGYENYKEYVIANGNNYNKEEVNANEHKVKLLKKNKPKWFLVAALTVIITILGMLLFKVSGIDNNVDSIANQCLYWELDRYKPINCDEKLPQALAKTKVAYTETLFQNFKKIPASKINNYKTALWYGSSPSGETEYFASDGLHPVTQKKLIRIESVDLNKEKKPTNEISISQPVIANHETKRARANTIGILIFENTSLDRTVTQQLEKGNFKSFNSKTNLITLNTLSESIKTQLLNGNLSSLNKSEINGLDYICVGTITYTYKKGSLSSKTIRCQLVLDYEVFSSKTGIKESQLSESITVNGIGFSEQEAKSNAIHKIRK